MREYEPILLKDPQGKYVERVVMVWVDLNARKNYHMWRDLYIIDKDKIT
jgi:hypothetical protein